MSSQETKERILQNALKLFALQGFEATSTRQIAQNSNANLSAISYHFENKEGLYKAVFVYCYKSVEHIIDTAPQKPSDRLSHYVLQVGQLHQKEPFIVRFVIANLTSIKPFMKELVAQWQGKLVGFFKETFQQGVENGDFKSHLNIQSTIVSFISIVNFYFFIAQFEVLPQGFDTLKKDYATNALDIFLNGIKA